MALSISSVGCTRRRDILAFLIEFPLPLPIHAFEYCAPRIAHFTISSLCLSVALQLEESSCLCTIWLKDRFLTYLLHIQSFHILFFSHILYVLSTIAACWVAFKSRTSMPPYRFGLVMFTHDTSGCVPQMNWYVID